MRKMSVKKREYASGQGVGIVKEKELGSVTQIMGQGGNRLRGGGELIKTLFHQLSGSSKSCYLLV